MDRCPGCGCAVESGRRLCGDCGETVAQMMLDHAADARERLALLVETGDDQYARLLGYKLESCGIHCELHLNEPAPQDWAWRPPHLARLMVPEGQLAEARGVLRGNLVSS